MFIKLYTNKGTKAHKDEVKALRNRFKGAANPWYVFLTANEVELQRFGGNLTIPGFLKRLADAKEAAGRTASAK